MDYRYRVKGRVKKAFIMRGAHFRVGGDIDTYILDREIGFVKEHCDPIEIVDMDVAPKPIPSNSLNNSREGKNELPRSASGTTKSKGKAKVSTDT